MFIGVPWNSGQGWKTQPPPPFTSFVTISLCFLCWDVFQKNPRPLQRGAIRVTDRQNEWALRDHAVIAKPLVKAPVKEQLGFRQATELSHGHETGAATGAHLTCTPPFFSEKL